jgi:hypothetical protein
MSRRILVTTTLIAGLIVGAVMTAGAASADETITNAQKIKQVQGCIDLFKEARSGWKEEVDVQATYTEKIDIAKGLLKKLQEGKDVPEVKILKVCRSPHSAPF